MSRFGLPIETEKDVGVKAAANAKGILVQEKNICEHSKLDSDHMLLKINITAHSWADNSDNTTGEDIPCQFYPWPLIASLNLEILLFFILAAHVPQKL